MRRSLFAGRRLRASYRGIPMDTILALLDRTDEQNEDFSDCCGLRPRRLRSRMKEEF
jgi:hypothetical protein